MLVYGNPVKYCWFEINKYCSTEKNERMKRMRKNEKNEYCPTANISLNEISKPGITQPFGIFLTHTLMMGF